MANLQRQIRRDTRANIAAYVLAQGEIGYGTDDGLLTIGDGVTAGGHLLPGPYAFGSWTPVLYGSGTAGAPTYTAQVGSWERIGRLVTCRFNVSISALGGMAGNLLLGGLPFSAANVANDYGSGFFMEFIGVTLDAGYSFAALQVAPNTNYATVAELGSNKAASPPIPVANLSASVGLCGTLTFRCT